jgi:hypothetical protein
MSARQSSSAKEHFNKLQQFRQAAYGRFGPARDALFELTDAVIQMRQIQSLAELSCAPTFRRQWSSAYEALQDGRPDRTGLLHLYLRQLPTAERLLLAGDHTAWPKLWAVTLPERSYQHQPTPLPGRRPVTIGHGYATLALIPELSGSWALPLLHERILQQKPIETAAQQLRQVCPLLPGRAFSLWDSEYGCAAFLSATAGLPVDKLLRLRTNLCLEGPTFPWKGRGRVPKHGVKFRFKDPTTWWAPDQVYEYEDPEFGPLIVRVWLGLRFRQALDCPMIVALVERLQVPGSRRKPRLIWLAWVGEAPPERWWSLYARRYPIDHWYRFAKGRLHWTLPRFASLPQYDRWSDLMPFLTWELWLARAVVSDTPLPWQPAQKQLSPGRVAQGLQNLLVAIGTPTRMCKSRGKAPGWPQGKPRTHRDRHEVVRSEQWKTIRERKKAQKDGQKTKRGRPKKVSVPSAA